MSQHRSIIGLVIVAQCYKNILQWLLLVQHGIYTESTAYKWRNWNSEYNQLNMKLVSASDERNNRIARVFVSIDIFQFFLFHIFYVFHFLYFIEKVYKCLLLNRNKLIKWHYLPLQSICKSSVQRCTNDMNYISNSARRSNKLSVW